MKQGVQFLVLHAETYEREMTEENSTTSHLSVLITTKEVDKMQTTGGRSMKSSSANEFEFYFQWAVVMIGVVGAATNALVLYALVASKQFKKHLLIINRGVVPLRHLRHVPPPQYCDCGPDWPLLFKVHEI